MPYVLKANQDAIEEPITRLSRYLNLEKTGFESFLQWVLELRSSLDIPDTLKDIATNTENNSRIGSLAAADSSGLTNAIIFSEKQYQEIFENALNGKL